MNFTVAESARDLGISYTAGKPVKPTMNISKQRTLKTKSRITRTIRLSKITKQARKLFSGSVFAASTWGHQSFGISATDVLRIERAAASSAGLPNGRCRFMTLCAAYGPRGHPYARIIKESIRLWFQTIRAAYNSSNVEREDLRLAWSKIKQERDYLKQKADSLVSGMMSSLIKLLSSLGWIPFEIDLWIHNIIFCGSQYAWQSTTFISVGHKV